MSKTTTKAMRWSSAARTLFSALALFAVSLSSTSVWAHGGEDHSHDEKPVVETIGNPRVEATSEIFEIVGIPTGAGDGKLVIHLNDFWSNVPVSKAAIEVTVGDATTKATEKQGLYELDAPWVKTPGRYDLTFSVTAGEVSDLLIGSLNIPAAPAPADQHNSLWDHIAPELPQIPSIPTWLPASAGALTLLLAVLAFTSSGTMRRSGLVLASIAGMSSVALAAVMLVNGSTGGATAAGAAILDLPDSARRSEDGAVFVPKATQRLLEVTTVRTAAASAAQKTVRLIGQVIPDPNKSGLVQALLAGRIEAPESGFPAIGSRVKAGDVLGYLLPSVQLVDQSDIRQTTGDLDRQIALAEAKLRRIEPLSGNAIPAGQVIDARIELDALRKRRAEIKPVAEREALIAPADGVIAQANAASGQVVEAQTLLFQIVDPESLWVEALAFDGAAATGVEKNNKGAIGTTADGRRIELSFAGRGLTLRQQAVPLRFKIKGSNPGLSIGEPVTVHAPVDEPIAAIPLPRSSVVRSGNGQSVVWAHTGPERFEQRVVASEPIDADRIGITAGLEPDTRVVVRGAELINQVR
jgi:cobalt-zinc-cadmium efflux system membrane fusion protein